MNKSWQISGNYNNDWTDEQLLEQYKKDSNEKFIIPLFDRYIEYVYGLSFSILKDVEDAQDVSMEIFEKLTSDLKKYEIKYFKSWLYRYTKNYCLQRIRKAKVREINPKDMHFETIEHLDLGAIAQDQILDNCIENLKSHQQEIIKAFYFEKTSYKQIAKNASISYDKVRSYLQNGRKQIKKCLEKNGFDISAY